jgi:uncharacterized protein YjbI with pentapeptide repeats
MANQEQPDRLLKQDVQAWNEWRRENPDVQVDLRGAAFNGANLISANLMSATLSNVTLSGATLRNVNLSKAILISAFLFGATFVAPP